MSIQRKIWQSRIQNLPPEETLDEGTTDELGEAKATTFVVTPDYEFDVDKIEKFTRKIRTLKIKVDAKTMAGGFSEVEEYIGDEISNMTGWMHNGFDTKPDIKKVTESVETANQVSSGRQFITEAQSSGDVIKTAELAGKWNKLYKGKKLSIKKGAKGVWINRYINEGYDFWEKIDKDITSEPVVSVEIRNTDGQGWLGPGAVYYEVVVFTEDDDVGFKMDSDKDITAA